MRGRAERWLDFSYFSLFTLHFSPPYSSLPFGEGWQSAEGNFDGERLFPFFPLTIYQLLPRLYGNRIHANISNGTLAENGCGKLKWIRQTDLVALRRQGYTHVWYTGLLEHATQTVYPGIAPDNPDIVKGKAGSPYAVKDYYDIDPDLAVRPELRMQEFRDLLHRTHKAGLKFVMDFVPNHVARHYESDSAPQGVRDLGADDDTALHFSPDNNFYYCPGETLRIGSYEEFPARATGNDHFDAHPSVNDWYETCKLNYGGMSPDSSTWRKMTDILLFWAAEGVDAFRCDMAEMVPVEFWQHAIATVRQQYPHIDFIAEVYNPERYRDYIHRGGFRYLYDKVGLYDTLRAVVTQGQSTHTITRAWQEVDDIRPYMLRFLENHDEQRIASPFFAGDALRGRPAMAVAALMDSSPLMVYAGQEIGASGMDAEGFSGQDGRTTIFDYWSPLFQRKLTGQSPLSPEEEELRNWHTRLLQLRATAPFAEGPFFDLMYVNPHIQRQYAFLRGTETDVRLIVANFADETVTIDVHIPPHASEMLRFTAASIITLTIPANDYITIAAHNYGQG